MPATFSYWRLFDALLRPFDFFADVAASRDLRPGLLAWAVTALLFAATLLASHWLHTGPPPDPLWPLFGSRLVLAACSPLLLGAGWLLCALAALACLKLLRGPTDARQVAAVLGPALFAPLWLLLWPTETALALGVFQPDADGFSGLWVRHIGPGLTLLYLVGLLSLASWQAFRLLVREAFAVAVLGLLPALTLWSLFFR